MFDLEQFLSPGALAKAIIVSDDRNGMILEGVIVKSLRRFWYVGGKRDELSELDCVWSCVADLEGRYFGTVEEERGLTARIQDRWPGPSRLDQWIGVGSACFLRLVCCRVDVSLMSSWRYQEC